MLTKTDYLYFAERAIDGMAAIVDELGDELANVRPDLPGSNTPYALLTHCLGVVEAWAGGFVGGRTVGRDRSAEFEASGPVDELLVRVEVVAEAFRQDVDAAEPGRPLRETPPAEFEGPDRELDQGSALQHVYEELAQHHGQMQIMRDVIVAANGRPAPASAPFDAIDPVRLRAGTGVKWGATDADVLPSWVADMDFGIPPAVRRAMRDVVDRQDFGYPYWPDGDPVTAAFERRMAARFGWVPRPDRSMVLSDLLQVLQITIEHVTRPGDGVAIHVPSYPPFLASIERSGRRIVPIPMVDDGERWGFDTDGLPARLAAEGVTLLVVVNPHNPTGRVLDRAELESLAGIAAEFDITVLADEIHADLAYAGHDHLPFASLSDDAASRTITMTSATKAFNIAGLRCAVAHVGGDRLWESIQREPLDYFGTPAAIGRVATVAAWEESHDWHDALMRQLDANRRTVAEWAAGHVIGHHSPDATYLGWLDLSRTPVAHDPAGEIERRGRVLVNPGHDFTQHTDLDARSFARINFATSADTLASILDRIGGTVGRH